MSLANDTPKDRYGDLLIVDNSGSGLTTSAQTVIDGGGTKSALSISDDVVNIQPQNDNTTNTLNVSNASGTSLLKCNTSIHEVYVHGSNAVNTGAFDYYANDLSLTANTWAPLPMSNSGLLNGATNTMGTGTNPATTLDVSAGTVASAIFHIRALQFDITIDEVIIWYTGDSASSDNIKFSLNSFTQSASGGTSGDLSSGIILSNSSASAYDNTKLYRTTLTPVVTSTDSGQALMFMAHQNGTNNDLYAHASIKYHIK